MIGRSQEYSSGEFNCPFLRVGLLVLLFLVLVLTPVYTVSGISKPTQNTQLYPSGSWALGVVVPENAQFADGGRLSWENVTALTVVARLPNITYTDAPTLAVQSVMVLDGSVLQVAAGIYPDSRDWYAYGWYIRNLQAYPQSYEWVLNSSRPEMAPGTSVSLSIYLSFGRWHYRIEEMTTKETVTGEYAFNVPPRLKSGDQEVFALESYSTSNGVFAHMGNMTLETLRINEKRVSSGWYPYGSWDTTHKPLFVVGGLTPPSYISLQESPDGTLDWSYQEWTSSGSAPLQDTFRPFFILLLGFIVIVIMISAIGCKTKRRSTS